MTKQVMIVAPADDPHAAALDWSLGRNGIDVVWVPSMRMGRQARLSIAIDNDGIQSRLSRMRPSGFSAVWCRRNSPPEPEDCQEADREFVATQWKFFERNALELSTRFIDALWVNRPAAAAAAESKLLQLEVAREIGLRIPETVVSNDAEQVRKLRDRYGKLIFKTFYLHWWHDEEQGKVFGSEASLIDQDTDLPEEAIALCPGIYQRYIEKAFDVRLTVIGQRMYAMRIHAAGAAGYVDWRPHVFDESVAIQPFEPPAPLAEKVRNLMARLGLVFGSIDFAVDRHGDFYFLEINQQGQFLFLEDLLPQQPILQAMTAMLASGRADYELALAEPVSMAAFRASDAYAAHRQKSPPRRAERSSLLLE